MLARLVSGWAKKVARVAKLVDAPSSGGGAVRCAGSNPVPGTNPVSILWKRGFYIWEALQMSIVNA